MSDNLGKHSIIDHKIHPADGKKVQFNAETLERIQKIKSHYPADKQKSVLIPVLHIAQEELGGYLSVDVMNYVAQLLNIQPIEVYEVATFYTQFYLEKTGKYVIEVCKTGPCAICGGENIADYLEQKLGIPTGETTKDGLFTLRRVECLGACGYAPVMQINTEFHEFLTKEKIDDIIEDLQAKANEPKPNSSRWAERFF
jgi:NADH-quinone oxidoreductase subunit E